MPTSVLSRKEILQNRSSHCEAAQAAVLSCTALRNTPLLTVKYAERQVILELRCGPEVVLRGPWEAEINLDGEAVRAIGNWECVCWESDDDVDYLEIELDLASGLRVQRQMLLARQDRFLLLADVVLAEQRAGLIEYVARMPLAEGIHCEGQEETREALLVGRRRRAVVMPLSLNEWKVDARCGRFPTGEADAELHLQDRGRGLYAPLFFDLHPRRLAKDRTWRQLTVAEDRQIQPRDVAVGYRVQVGREQWVIYRSLNGKASRSLLGLNIYNEFAVGRFTRKGEMQSLVEIE